MRMILLVAGCALAVSGVALASAGDGGRAGARQGATAAAEVAGDRLGARIESAIKGDGPFFTAAEREVIERKCGYPAGSFDGFEVNISDGVLTCRGGRRVDDAEMRALLAVAEPRIEKRVEAVMGSADVQDAVTAVAAEAERVALASVDAEGIARDTSREVAKALREASREMEKARIRR